MKKITDQLGKGIDPNIRELVVALRLHGINTTSSCEGHLDHITGGPYVMFESPAVHTHAHADPGYKNQYDAAAHANMKEVAKVLGLLDGFYKDRVVPIQQRLIVTHVGPLAGRLMCQGADLAYISDKGAQQELLAKNQHEAQAFADYLHKIIKK